MTNNYVLLISKMARASHAPDMCLFLCLFPCLLADIANKHQHAGQSVLLQISAYLAGGRSAYQHRYDGLNSVFFILSALLTSSNYMGFHILTLNFKIRPIIIYILTSNHALHAPDNRFLSGY